MAETETGKAIQFSEAVPPIQLRETIRNPFPVIGTLIPSHPAFPFPRGAISNREAFSPSRFARRDSNGLNTNFSSTV